MPNNRKPHVFVLRFAAVLLVLVMLSTSMVAGRYARYVTTAMYEDSARVAKFHIVDGTAALFADITTELEPNTTAGSGIVLKNLSEVAVEYTIEVETVYDNLPLTFVLKEGEKDLEGTRADGHNRVTFTGTIGPNQGEKEYTLTIKWIKGENEVDLNYSGMVDVIRVRVNVSQVD